MIIASTAIDKYGKPATQWRRLYGGGDATTFPVSERVPVVHKESRFPALNIVMPDRVTRTPQHRYFLPVTDVAT
jgi:hypothetical protein